MQGKQDILREFQQQLHFKRKPVQVPEFSRRTLSRLRQNQLAEQRLRLIRKQADFNRLLIRKEIQSINIRIREVTQPKAAEYLRTYRSSSMQKLQPIAKGGSRSQSRLHSRSNSRLDNNPGSRQSSRAFSRPDSKTLTLLQLRPAVRAVMFMLRLMKFRKQNDERRRSTQTLQQIRGKDLLSWLQPWGYSLFKFFRLQVCDNERIGHQFVLEQLNEKQGAGRARWLYKHIQEHLIRPLLRQLDRFDGDTRYLLWLFSKPNQYPLPLFYFKFELLRLNFDQANCYLRVKPNQSQILLIGLLLVRAALEPAARLYQKVPSHSKMLCLLALSLVYRAYVAVANLLMYDCQAGLLTLDSATRLQPRPSLTLRFEEEHQALGGCLNIEQMRGVVEMEDGQLWQELCKGIKEVGLKAMVAVRPAFVD